MKVLFLVVFVVAAINLTACRALLPFEKEYLVSPLMDDAQLRPFSSEFLTTRYANLERLSGQGVAGQSGSCATCGG